jgi:hypothetical protein
MLPARHNRLSGFTLVDVMMASIILVVAFVGMIEAVGLSSTMMNNARRQTMAAQIIGHEMELLRLQSWNAINALPAGPSGSTWSSATAYTANAVVINGGAWYVCILANTNKPPPNLVYWVPYMTWNSSQSYVVSDIVSLNGVWYRCILAHSSNTSNTPPNATYWTTYSGPISSNGVASGATFNISRNVTDVVAGNLRQVVFTVSWVVRTSRKNTDGTTLAFAYTRVDAAYYGKYGLNLTYQRQ